MHSLDFTGNIPGLNALRLVGALSVVALHLGSYGFFRQLGISEFHTLASGRTGVVLFYVISGFLITSLAIDEVKRNGSFDLIRFFVRRALRLFPLYYLALLSIAFLDFLSVVNVPREAWPYSIFYSYNFITPSAFSGNLSSFHTLATEEQFYIFFGVIAALSSARARGHGAFLVKLIFWFFLLWLASQVAAEWVESSYKIYKPKRILFNALDPILIGCMGAVLCKSVPSRSVRQVASSRFVFLIPLLLLSGSFFSYFYFGVVSISEAGMAVGFLLLITYLYYFREGKIVSFFNSRFFTYGGNLSYGLYIWQSVVLGTGSSSRLIESKPIALVVVCVVSVLAHEMYEKPITRLRHRIFDS